MRSLEPLIGAWRPPNEGERVTSLEGAALGVLVVAGVLVLLWLISALVAVVLLYRVESPNRAPWWLRRLDDRRTGNR